MLGGAAPKNWPWGHLGGLGVLQVKSCEVPSLTSQPGLHEASSQLPAFASVL